MRLNYTYLSLFRATVTGVNVHYIRFKGVCGADAYIAGGGWSYSLDILISSIVLGLLTRQGIHKIGRT